MTTSMPNCANCGAEMAGPWCGQCGQKRVGDEDRRFTHLLGQFGQELFRVDGKLPRTLVAFLFRPGALSRAWLDGQRIRYLAPISLFLLINLVYFLAPPVTDFNLSLSDQMYMQPYSGLVEAIVERRIEGGGVSLDALASDYRRHADSASRSLIILHLPLLGLALLLLHPRRRMYYAEHFVVATHLFSFLLAVMILGQAFLHVGTTIGARTTEMDLQPLARALWRSFPLVILLYWGIALHRIYQTRWWRSLGTLAGWSAGVVVAHFVYRFVQFVVAFSLS